MWRVIGTRVRPSVSSRESSVSVSLRLRPAARRIGNDADRVPARRLAAREVADVPEQAADRRAQHMEDFQARRHFSDSPFLNVVRGLQWTRDRSVSKSLRKGDAPQEGSA